MEKPPYTEVGKFYVLADAGHQSKRVVTRALAEHDPANPINAQIFAQMEVDEMRAKTPRRKRDRYKKVYIMQVVEVLEVFPDA